MAQAIMDPEKVRRFADELNRFNTDLENRLVLLQARFTALLRLAFNGRPLAGCLIS